MSQYKKLVITPPEAISKISELFVALKSGIDIILNAGKMSVEFAKLQASSANIALMALSTALEEIITELEGLKGGVFSGIIAHPYAYGVVAGYDKNTDTMTLTASSAISQVQDAFDDTGDIFAPDKINNYGGLVIVGATPGIEDFMAILQSVGKFFNQQELIDLWEQIKERFEDGEPDVKLSKGLDFIGLTMAMLFPIYTTLLNKIQSFVEGINSGIISASGSLDDITGFIDDKLADAEELAQDMKDFMDQFVFEISEAGIYYKTFVNEKADDIKEGLAEGTPESWKTSKHSLVVGIFGGSGSVELLFKLLKLD